MARDVMTSTRSTPNLQQQVPPATRGVDPHHLHHASIYSYLHTQSGLNFAPVVHHRQGESGGGGGSSSPPPAPPVRDASSLKGIKYGPGHEKFPSWPVSAAADTPAAAKAAPGGGSHRSKSWTDHTNYPKEKGMTYTRPYMKRPNPAFTQQQLKTVMERCEKLPPEMFDSRPDMLEDSQGRLYLPKVDREGKALGDLDYLVPSPPERDLEEFKPGTSPLTQADLEEYARVYQPQLQQQPSYAQSEGYHSYVSSTDSTTTTPFLDRLRRDSEMCVRPVPGPQAPWPDDPPERDRDRDRPGRDSVVTTSSGSASSSETLKWHGSLSDVSVASSNCTQQGSSSASSSRQLIAHSARVQTPQRHHSESVLYLGGAGGNRVARNNQHNKLRLFPVHTYTVQPQETQQVGHRSQPLSPSSQPALSVAERISELERQQLQTRYTYLDPDKRLRVSDTNLKAIQKKALLSFYERHHGPAGRTHQAWRSEPQLAQSAPVPAPQSPPPQPPPRPGHSSRRASSASDYAGGAWKQMAASRETMTISESNGMRDPPRHQHSSSLGSLSADLLGPLIIGPSISVDDWVPERPHKPPHLRAAFPPPPVPERMPSPDLPPPSPPPVLEDEVFATDEPLPPPPPELHPVEWSVPAEKRHADMTMQKQKPLEGNSDLQRCPDKNTQSHRHSDYNNLSDRLQDGASLPSRHTENAHTLQRLCIPVPRHSDSSSLSPRHQESALTSQRNEGVSLSVSRHQEVDTVVQSSSDSVSSAHRLPEFDPAAPRHSETGSFSSRHQETVSQRHENIDQKSSEIISTAPKLPEGSLAVHRQSETDTLSERHPDNGASIHKHSENDSPVQRHVETGSTDQRLQIETGSTVPRHPENSNQRHFDNGSTVQKHTESAYSNQRHPENNSAIPRHSETGFTVHRLSEGCPTTQKYSQNSSLSPRYLESSYNIQRHSEMGSTFQRYPETTQRHTESGHAIHRYLETGSTAQRYQENLFPTHRHQDVTGSTVHRHTERSSVTQKHLEHEHHAQRHVMAESNHSTLQRPIPQRHHEAVHPTSVQRQSDNLHLGGTTSNQRSCENSSSQLQQNINKYHRHPESHKIHQQYLDQRHMDNNNCALRHSDMSNPSSQKHSENESTVHWPQQGNTSMQKSIQNTTSPHHEGVSIQKCLENGLLSQAHAEHTENRCLENGVPTSRYSEQDTRLSHRYSDGGTLSRRYAESNKSLDGSSTVPNYQDSTLHNQKPSEKGTMAFQPVSTSISSMYRNTNSIYSRSTGMKSTENLSRNSSVASTGQQSKTLDGRSTMRYSTQKLVVNGKLATPLGDRSIQNGGFTDSVRATELERLSLRSGNFSMPARARLQRLPLVVPNGDTTTTPYMHTSPKSPSITQSMSPVGQKSPTQSQSPVGSRSPPHSQPLSPVGSKLSPRGQSAHSPSEAQSQSPVGARSPAHFQQLSPGRQRSPTQSQQVSPAGQGSPTQSVSSSPALLVHGMTDVAAHSSPAASPTHSQQSTSRASYLAYRRDRDRGLPNFEGSYKRTMSPSGQECLDTPVTPVPECERLPTMDPVSVPVEEKSEHHSASHQHSPCTEVPDPVSVVPRTIEEVVLEAVTDPPRNSDLTSDKCAPVVIETETQCDLTETPVQRLDTHLPQETPPEVSPSTLPKSPPPPSRTNPKVMESLQLMQRSEVVLRVNAPTSDAASQTETEALPEPEAETQLSETVATPPVLVRQKLQEEIECERLSLDLASQLPPSDKLQGILVPDPEHKKPTDYVSGLFRLDVALRPRTTAFRSQVSNNSSLSSASVPVPSSNGHVSSEEGSKENSNTPVSPLPASSKYFTISESKAKFLTRYVRDMSQLNGLQDNKDLHQKKEELMARLDRKLEVLRGEHLVVTEESRVNDELGESVAAQVSRLARPHEAAKYRLHVEEVGKITSLLLGLSGRLARAENALMGLPHHHSERKILESKRDKLKDQLEEAKKLKENIDRRSVSVSNILYKYFNSEEYADYDHFINMKAKLIMDSREIADKIKLGEEQLAALKETLCSSD